MLTPAFFALAQVALTNGAAIARREASTTATYDNLAVSAVTQLNVMGKYKGLNYDGFFVNDGSTGLTGVNPKSAPNVITSGEEAQLEGKAIGFSTTGTSTNTFDLHSFYFGCSVNAENADADVPEACTIEIQAYKSAKDQVPVASVTKTFHPAVTDVSANPVIATFGKTMYGVELVRIRQVESEGGDATIVLILDNLVYTTHGEISA